MGEEFPSEAWVKAFQERVEKKLKVLALSVPRVGVEVGDLIVLQVFLLCERCGVGGQVEVPMMIPNDPETDSINRFGDFAVRQATAWMVEKHHLIQEASRALTAVGAQPMRRSPIAVQGQVPKA